MGIIKIEQIGGLAGIGDPSSALQRVGEFDDSLLDTDQKQAVEKLFKKRRKSKVQGADRAMFQLSRQVGQKDQTVIIAEGELPPSFEASLSLKFK